MKHKTLLFTLAIIILLTFVGYASSTSSYGVGNIAFVKGETDDFPSALERFYSTTQRINRFEPQKLVTNMRL